MPNLRNKAEFNFDAAEILIKESYYAPSIHCSYYSCFQRIKYIICDYEGYTYESIWEKVKELKYGEHVFCINKINELLEKSNQLKIRELNEFDSLIKELKQSRVDSDYMNIQIDSEMASKAYKMATSIHETLKKVF